MESMKPLLMEKLSMSRSQVEANLSRRPGCGGTGNWRTTWCLASERSQVRILLVALRIRTLGKSFTPSCL